MNILQFKNKIDSSFLVPAAFFTNEDEEYISSPKQVALWIPDLHYEIIVRKFTVSNQKMIKFAVKFNFHRITKIKADFTISVIEADVIEEFSEEFEGSGGIGFKVTEMEVLDPQNDYFKNGLLKVQVIGLITCMNLERRAFVSSKIGQATWKQEDTKDVTFVIKKREIKAHQYILEIYSDVLKTELNCGMKESVEKMIKIKDFEFDTVSLALKFCYEMNIEEDITYANGQDLLRFADKYNLKKLQEYMEEILIKFISEKTICELANSAHLYNSCYLLNVCYCVIQNYTNDKIIPEKLEELNSDILAEWGRRKILQGQETKF